MGNNAPPNISAALTQKSGTSMPNQAQLQAVVMDFSDAYVMFTWQAFDEIRQATPDPQMKAMAQHLKVITTSNAMTIATGPHAVVNLLDMLVFVSLDRHTIETYWAPKVFGLRSEPLLKASRKLEQEIWKTSGRVLSKDQQKKLRDLINQWIDANPNQHYIAAIRFNDFDELHGGGRASQLAVGSLIEDVEKAVAVAEKGLILSERVMFLAERAPRLMTMQADLILDQIAAKPDAELLRSNLTRLTAATERLSLAATDLPKQLTEERKAALDHAFNRVGTERKQLIADLESQESHLRGVLEEVRALLDRTIPLTDKVNTTVHSADALYRLYNSTPNRIDKYNNMLEKSIVAMDKLEHIISEVTPLYAAASKDGSVHNDPLFGKTLGLADHLFWRGMQLITFFLVGLLAVLLVYKRISLKMSGDR
jgi:methyl-accepting chemotaxis protein